MARILVVDLERDWRGGQEQALILMRGLLRRGHSIELLTVENSAIAAHARTAGIRVHEAKAHARRLNAARQIRRLARSQRFQILYANEAHALTAVWLARSGVPFIAARRVVFPVSRSKISLARYRSASAIIAISEAVQKELIAAALDSRRIRVIPDGVEIPTQVQTANRARARERWGFAADDFVIICVAALTEEKGHALLIEAFRELTSENAASGETRITNQQGQLCAKEESWVRSKSRLLMAGDGPLRARLMRQVHEAGIASAVTFSGFVDDVDSVYAAGDLFAFPSHAEGAGSSLLRAMAFGIPTVALARGGIVEVIEDGRTGILVREAEPRAFAAAIARLMVDRDLQTRLSRAGRQAIAEHYSAERMVEATENVFEEVIAGEM